MKLKELAATKKNCHKILQDKGYILHKPISEDYWVGSKNDDLICFYETDNLDDLYHWSVNAEDRSHLTGESRGWLKELELIPFINYILQGIVILAAIVSAMKTAVAPGLGKFLLLCFLFLFITDSKWLKRRLGVNTIESLVFNLTAFLLLSFSFYNLATSGMLDAQRTDVKYKSHTTPTIITIDKTDRYFINSLDDEGSEEEVDAIGASFEDSLKFLGI